MSIRRAAAFALLLVAPLAASLAGCAENPAATAKCNTEKDSDGCQKCCKANGASGYKYINGACSCLGK